MKLRRPSKIVVLVSFLLGMLFGFIFVIPAFAGDVDPPTDPRVSVQDAFCATGDETAISVSFEDPTNAVDALVFSLDIPDGLVATAVNPYPDFEGMIIFDPTDPDGEVDFAAWIFAPTGTIPTGVIADVTLSCPEAGSFAVVFSTDPSPSAGADGVSVPLLTDEASVDVVTKPTAVTLEGFSAKTKPFLPPIHEWVLSWFK